MVGTSICSLSTSISGTNALLGWASHCGAAAMIPSDRAFFDASWSAFETEVMLGMGVVDNNVCSAGDVQSGPPA